MTIKFKLINDSGDRKYFSILPHFILNHSTANDQALYWQMKRYTGENGNCFATEKTLMGKLGIGKKAYDKSLKYLISRGWIEFVGLTKGKTRPVKTYKINNIWRENVEHYDKISVESNISFRGDKFQKQYKISAESNVEEEPSKEDIVSTNVDTSNSKSVASQILHVFEKVNPAIKRMYGNKTQREAAENLVRQFGLETTLKAAQAAISVLGVKYAPRITTPYLLETKWADLVAFLKENKNGKIVKIS